MHLVRHPREALTRALLTVALVAGVLLAGCGSGGGTPPPHLGGVVNLGTDLRLANCTDWKNGTLEERLGTIGQIRNYVSGPVGNGGGHGNTLDDKRAYDVMNEWCSQSFARGFKLYKLYTRSAAFTPPQGAG